MVSCYSSNPALRNAGWWQVAKERQGIGSQSSNWSFTRVFVFICTRSIFTLYFFSFSFNHPTDHPTETLCNTSIDVRKIKFTRSCMNSMLQLASTLPVGGNINPNRDSYCYPRNSSKPFSSSESSTLAPFVNSDQKPR